MSFRWLALGLLLVGCASELVTSARRDELQAFRQKLLEESRAENSSALDPGSLREVAEAVATRELLHSSPAQAERRVVEVATCADALLDPLEQLAEEDHTAAAIATQVLIDAKRWDGDLDSLVQRFATDGRDAWRAVGLRAAVRPEHAGLRAKGFLDPDLRVRRAAVQAARDARIAGDAEALFEVARLDPDRVSRRFALLALGENGSPEMLARLRELWGTADEDGRRAMVETWASSHAFGAGGSVQLAWVLSTQSGLPQLEAALALLRGGERREAARAERVLVRAIESGTTEETQFAAERAPQTDPMKKATTDLAASKDAARAVWAAMRMAFSDHDATRGRERLLELSRSPVGQLDAARYALAVLGESKSLGWVESELSAPDAERRFKAGVVRLERGDAEAVKRVAVLLADPDSSVRTRFACWVLRADKPGFDYFHSQVRP